jgi:hypothetical protein
LVTDPELRRRMGDAARRHVAARYDADRVYNGLIDRLVRLADDP